MELRIRVGGAVAATLLIVSVIAAAEPFSGWRGNGTGLWPDARPPLEWSRIPRGSLDGMRSATVRPSGDGPGDAAAVLKGLLRDWLVIGPFPVADSVRDFDSDALGGESSVVPESGKKVGDREWKTAATPADDFMVFGTAELAWLDLVKAIGFERNRFAYAHTYVFSPRGGPARIVVDHAHGLKAWVNGREVYREPKRGVSLSSYVALSKHELAHLDQPSPRFDVTLNSGWNRLLLKLSTSNREDFTDMRFALRIMDPPDVKYESKNIAWMTPLPGRSTSTPILAADRLLVMAEPDELLCLDKRSGRILWSAAVNPYEALRPEERKAKPAYAEKVDPLVARLHEETDRLKRVGLQAEIQKALEVIDPERFKIDADGHFAAHFGIVGFTMPTPVSDGRHVWVWTGRGVAASFDLDGKRQWITQLKTDHLTYGSSPALVDGVLVVFQNGLFGLDAKTGKLLWEQRKVRNNVAAVQGATFGGRNVIVTQRGDVLRPTDGEFLFRPRGSTATGDIGWAPPLILGPRMFLPKYGVSEMEVLDFADLPPEGGEPKSIASIRMPPEINRRKDGGWLDRWTAGSPLVRDGIAYQNDIYQTLYAVELKSGRLLYRKEMELEGLTHYNAVAVAASPTLVGKHLLLADNQGTTLVIEPGPEYKVVARNRIATQMERTWPIPAQETLTYAPPLADDNHLYLRGEGFFYCVGP